MLPVPDPTNVASTEIQLIQREMSEIAQLIAVLSQTDTPTEQLRRLAKAYETIEMPSALLEQLSTMIADAHRKLQDLVSAKSSTIERLKPDSEREFVANLRSYCDLIVQKFDSLSQFEPNIQSIGPNALNGNCSGYIRALKNERGIEISLENIDTVNTPNFHKDEPGFRKYIADSRELMLRNVAKLNAAATEVESKIVDVAHSGE